MKKIRINNFYEIIDTNDNYDISKIKRNLNDMKSICTNDRNINIKYYLLKLLTFLIYALDILVLCSIVIFNTEIGLNLLIVIFGLNILVGILLTFNNN